MGRIKQQYLKRAADELLEKYPDEFNAEFQNNKVNVGKYCTVEGKTIRNKIAGYITRLLRQKAEADK